jgi:antitoxin (DNA-binding transcriptional repressor) of toxin-antitoxin stability system
MVMIRLNIREAQAHLSRYLSRLQKGETIVLCKRNIPIAEIRPIPQPNTEKRPIGLDKGKFEIAPAFFEPLPDDLIAAFNPEALPKGPRGR